MKKGGIGIVILFMVLIGPAYADELVLVAGPRGGDLLQIGERLAEMVTDDELIVRTVPSGGDSESITAVIGGSADLAVVDSISAYEASLGIGRFSSIRKGRLSAVVVLGLTVQYFILTAPMTDSGDITDLKDKIIYIGPEGDPAGYAARTILASSEIESFSEVGQDWDSLTSAQMIIDGAIDGAVYSGAVPHDAVSYIASVMGEDIVFLEVPDDTLMGLRNACPVWFPFVVPEKTYRGMDEPYKTVARPLLLVAAETLDKGTVEELVGRLFADTNRESLSRLPYPTTESMSFTHCPIRLHPGAAEYFKQKGY